jgi:hypothetical protein
MASWFRTWLRSLTAPQRGSSADAGASYSFSDSSSERTLQFSDTPTEVTGESFPGFDGGESGGAGADSAWGDGGVSDGGGGGDGGGGDGGGGGGD